MGGMAGAVSDAGTAIAGKAKEAVAFGVGNIIDSTGAGALTGTGFNSASTALSASGGVLDAVADTLKEGFVAEAGGGSSESGGSSSDLSGKNTSSLAQHKEDFMDGLTGNGSSFVRDENGDWDISRSLAKGAGKFIQNKVEHLGDKNNVDKDFAQEELKRMMAQQMVQG